MEEALAVENLSKIGQIFACVRRKHVAMVESNKHILLNQLETLISIWKRLEFFSSKARVKKEDLKPY